MNTGEDLISNEFYILVFRPGSGSDLSEFPGPAFFYSGSDHNTRFRSAVLLQIYINFVLQLILPFIPVDALRIVARVLDLGEVELPLETDGQAAQVAGHPAFT